MSPAPPFSPHGVIGQSPSLTHDPIDRVPPPNSSPSPILASQPKTPGHDTNVDLGVLVANAQRDIDHARMNVESVLGPRGLGVIGDGMGGGVKADGSGGGGQLDGMMVTPPLRRPDSNTIWDRGNTTSKWPIHIPSSAPHSAPLPRFQPFTDPNPLILPPGHPLQSSPSQQPAVGDITFHLNALTSLFEPLLAGSEEVEQLRNEVDLWKSEWVRAEKDKKRLEKSIADNKTNLTVSALICIFPRFSRNR